MKKGKSSSVKRIMAFALLCLAVLPLFVGCMGRAGEEHTIILSDDRNTTYPDIIAQVLPDYTILTRNNTAFQHLQEGYITKAFEPQAVSALKTGVAAYWYPHYLATLVIAIDRDRTDTIINSWSDLRGIRDEVGVASVLLTNLRVNNLIVMATISYALEGDNFTLERVTELLRTLQVENRLVSNSFDPPVVICYDFQAADLISSGRNIEVIVPSEGTLTFERGLLSNIELTFNDDLDDLLIAAGFRLPDGRKDPALYPNEADYVNATRLTDYEHFNTAGMDTTRVLRQNILRTRLYSSKDSRQHQWWVLIYIIIITLWASSLIFRISHKNMINTVSVVYAILLGWIMARLLSYQLYINSDFRRYLAYSYYMFRLSLPIALMWLAYIMDKREGNIPVPWWIKAFTAYMFALIALIYTNDLHNWMFVYDFTSPHWGNEYTHAFVYHIANVSLTVSLAAVFFVMLSKSRGAILKTGVLFFILFFVIFAAYLYGYQTNIPIARDSDLTMVAGVFVLLFAESLIRAGLIPVNTKYEKLFSNSRLGIQITDHANNLVFSSASGLQYENEENTLRFMSNVPGGNVLWQEDISSLNKLHAEVEESVQKLAAANTMLAESEKIERAAQEEIAKTQLLTQLEHEISGYIAKLSDRIDRLGDVSGISDVSDINGSVRQDETAQAARLLCYVKRRCNLFYIEKETDLISADNLAVYLDEMVEIAGYSGVKITLTNELKTGLPVRHATLFYDYFNCAIEWAENRGGMRILALFGTERENIVLRLLPTEDAGSFQIDTELAAAIVSAGGSFVVKDLDDAFSLSLYFPGTVK